MKDTKELIDVNHELIGRLSMEYYIADCERFNARKQRAVTRREHLCKGEHYDAERDGVIPMPCHFSGQPVAEWCDNCLYVQPFYLVYMEAAKKARIAKYKLTCYCKKLLWNEGN